MEVNVKDARARISSLLDKTQKGEEIMIVRRGKRIARLVPIESVAPRRLPDLSAFRDSMKIKGLPLSQTVIKGRGEERY
jgi:prevent-host-death family protein